MATSPFELEDQTDEDFFDKLVNDEIEFTGSGSSFVKNDGLDEAKAFSNLSIAEVGSVGVDSGSGDDGEMGHEDLVVPAASLDANEETLVGDESNSMILGDTNESSSVVGEESVSSMIPEKTNEGSEVGIGEEGALHSAVDENSASMGTGVKVVQWSSFGSEMDVSGGGFGSYSDFFSELRENSEDPFDSVAKMDKSGTESNFVEGVPENPVADLGASNYGQHQEGQYYGAVTGQNKDGQELSSSQYWENLYPGWKYDTNTGQWYQLEGYDANASTNADITVDANAHAMGNAVLSDHTTSGYYQQQTAQAQSVVGTVDEGCTTGGVSHWNQISQGNMQYPAHMVFDPNYPDWYYDTITKEWKLLETYTPASNQLTSVDHNQQYQNQNVENHGSQSLVSQEHVANWDGSVSNYNKQIGNMWQTQHVANSDTKGFTESHKLGNHYSSIGHLTDSVDQQSGFIPHGSLTQYEQPNRSVDGSSRVAEFQSFISYENFSQHQNQEKKDLNQHMHFSPAHLDSQKPAIFSQQLLQSGTQFSYAPSEGRSSAGRPPHALATFGFGGKLIVMKDNNSFLRNSYESQDSVGGVLNVLNLMEVVTDKTDASSFGLGARDYFYTLCQQSFPGPLVGGNVGSRELNKWIDEKIANCESPIVDHRKGEVLRLLFSLLKISCQYYGKLRSPFGTDLALMESDCPESAIAKLFTTSKRKSEYGALGCCLQNFPSEAQLQATALKAQSFLVSGRKKEALQCAQEGQLWGPALVLASQLGDQFYVDTVKQMALYQFVAGSPLRTLCLLIAGQPAEVFSSATTSSTLPGSVDIYQQPAKNGANCMLEEWEENLAIITANRTKDDELVIIHLGDCLWKEHWETTAAHICYLVAEASFEPYSDTARLCLIGADHWKFPRTYASPEAIQRTELYEYSKVLGNSQFLLLPFQPYKLIYAHMLAEVGKVADALKYCQAILKSLKTGRAPEVDMWRQLVLSLEERIKTHQQGGYGTNLAPAKLVGKLLTFFDSTAHRVVGGLPPPVPSTSHSSAQHNAYAYQPGGPKVSDSQSTMAMSSLMPAQHNEYAYQPGGPKVSNSQSTMAMSSLMPAQHNEYAYQPGGPKVSNSQSTMAMSSLMPSASMEPINEWAGESKIPNRSISEPDFGRAPKKVDSSKETNSFDTQKKASASGGPSRLGRFRSQLFEKALGLVSRSRPDRQAKLGEKNKFYYDEKLKRWVEEGTEPPPEEAALPPPPTTAPFPNGMQDYNVGDAPKTGGFHSDAGLETKSPSSGIPPIPPSSNQFSARGRMGVRSRYVDTFNKGGGTPSNLFQSPSIPAAKPGGGSNPNFFIPTPVASVVETVQTPGESMQEATLNNANPPTSVKEDFFSSPQTSTSSSASLQRFPSMDNIVQRKTGPMAHGTSLVPPPSRRAASWSGSLNDACNPSMMNELKPLGEVLGVPPSLYRPVDPSAVQFSPNRNSSGEDLHEVDL